MSTNTGTPPKSILKTSLPSAHAAWAPLAEASDSTSKPVVESRHAAAPPDHHHRHQVTEKYKSRPGTDPRHLAVALHHAHRIQAQKDTESLILDRILELVQFPASIDADPAAPSEEDARAFKTSLGPFQPSDYDNLILERNIEGLCGYGLCPREHRKEDRKVKNRIVWGPKGSGPEGRGREMKIVPREKLEMWCSDGCAERAMYVKVQLREQPVWERRAGDRHDDHIMLLEEARATKRKGKMETASSATIGEAVQRLGNLQLDEERPANSRSRDLALERGDSSFAVGAGRVDVQLVEKERVSPDAVTTPELNPGGRTAGSVEGHVPKERQGTGSFNEEDQEDVLDLI